MRRFQPTIWPCDATLLTASLRFMLAVSSAESAAPPRELHDAGDFYLLADRTPVPLYGLAGEIAVKRAKAGPAEAVANAVAGEAIVLAIDAPGAPDTYTIEVYSVRDAARALDRAALLDDVVWASPVLANPTSLGLAFLTDEVIVQLDETADTDAMLKEWVARGLEIVEGPSASAPAIFLLRHPGKNTAGILNHANELAGLPGVELAEPNLLVEGELHSTFPNDEFFERQQGLHNEGQNGGLPDADIDAPEAWDIRRGHERLVIAIIDMGVDTGHPDLNIFRNPSEYGDGRESDGVDNDGNGYIDDYQGWDFYGADNNPNPGTTAGAAHGTACAGVAAAKADNDSLGVAGTSWGCRILPVRIGEEAILLSFFMLGKSIRYAAQFADVINCSWGTGSLPSSYIESAVNYAASAGRSGKGCGVLASTGNNLLFWGARTHRVEVPSPGGLCRFAFRYLSRAGDAQNGQVAIDQVRLLSHDGYTSYLGWRHDLEPPDPQWPLDRSSANIPYWSWSAEPPRLGSTRCYRFTPFAGPQEGEWTEVLTPEVCLSQENYILAYITDTLLYIGGVIPEQFEVWLVPSVGDRVRLMGTISGGARYAPGWIDYPARYANAIAIGACSDLGIRSYYSDFGVELFAVAPSNGGWNDVVTTVIVGLAASMLIAPAQETIQVDFRNYIPGRLDAPVFEADGVTRLAPRLSWFNQPVAQLCHGKVDSEYSLVAVPYAPSFFQEGTAAGYWEPQQMILSDAKLGERIWVQVRAWERIMTGPFEEAVGLRGASKVLSLVLTNPLMTLVGLESFSLQPEQLRAFHQEDQVVVQWLHEGASKYELESADNPAATNSWATIFTSSTQPIGYILLATNPVVGSQRFYRLKRWP